MLVLIATNEQQGSDPADYSFTVEGELVTPLANECASGGQCGCNRGFPGLASGFATTTAMVVDRPGVTEDDLRDAVFGLDGPGWLDRTVRGPPHHERADSEQRRSVDATTTSTTSSSRSSTNTSTASTRSAARTPRAPS